MIRPPVAPFCARLLAANPVLEALPSADVGAVLDRLAQHLSAGWVCLRVNLSKCSTALRVVATGQMPAL